MYLYDINENTCINLEKIETMTFNKERSCIHFYNSRDTSGYTKSFLTSKEAREEYDRIKAMINNPPIIANANFKELKKLNNI